MRHLWNTFRDWLGSDWLLIPLLLFGPLMVLWSQNGCVYRPVPAAEKSIYREVSEHGILVGNNSTIAGRTYQGEVLDCDLPGPKHIKNIGSKVDGAGMCVMSSIEMAAIYQNMDKRWVGLRDWCANDPGGAYPQKVVQQLDAYAKAKGIPNGRDLYMQYEGPDPWPIVEAALKTGRMPCITYGTSPRYGQQSIAHMVCAVKGADGKYAAILDNNFPGEEAYEWMTREELKRRINYPNQTGWVFVWLTPPPPPSPRNRP